ncbi:hypothetical protein NM688_g8298 [Phlebia brevispora]|uniref:Uncharacterized protein n=1 Tax=Phlebia brevispora TaxID=194682 RepID=A0ACC1RU76_9APHY|nr:hypothetical protein NM688_g8298 [Phlebia brevispora]
MSSTTSQIWTATALVATSLYVGYALGLRSAAARQTELPNAKPAEAHPDTEDEEEEVADGDLSAVKPGFMEPCKLVLVVRTDLGMTPGKIAAQCGHATLACYKALMKTNPDLLRHWELTGQAKIALKGSSEEQLDELEAIAKSLNLCARAIHDAGRTQIAAGSKTVLGIGPELCVRSIGWVAAVARLAPDVGITFRGNDALCADVMLSTFPFTSSSANLIISPPPDPRQALAMTSIALARVYQQSFETHPYTTLALTNGALNALGDFVAQFSQNLIQPPKRDDEGPRYDFNRTARFFAFGLGMGPLIGRWNLLLERHFPLRKHHPYFGQVGNVSLRALGKRVAADQLIMAPVGLAIFLGSMGIMEGRDKRHIQEKYQDLFRPLIAANWQVWPLAQLINFRFMPLPYRVPFQSTCGVFWTLYLSITNSKENEVEDQRDGLRQTLDS